MKYLKILLLVFASFLLSACAAAGQPGAAVTSLVVSGDDIQKTYTRADLEALPISQAVFNEVTYRGVSVVALIQDAGFDPAQIKAVKAIAADGYAVNYDPAQVLAADVIVAYARVDGELPAEDGTFRMVLPGAEGKLNVRMLVTLQVIP